MDIFYYSWIAIQIVVGYNLLFPSLLFLIHKFGITKLKSVDHRAKLEADYAIIVTAYEQTDSLSYVIDSISKLSYSNYVVYIVADNCDVSNVVFENDKVVILRPEQILASNTKSHMYAVRNFTRAHQRITIIDSDNLLDPDYLDSLNLLFDQGFEAVQGVRRPKNIDTDIAALDAARDIYYHYYDGKLLFECGSSATLSGSGMAFKAELYIEFLEKNHVNGAGFDKVLQAWLVKQGYRIAYADKATVYDEKTSRSEQLVHQRSRWINSWFKYLILGVHIIFDGIKKLNLNQFLFGLVLLRPPLFLFIVFSGVFMVVNLFFSIIATAIWLLAFLIFILSFYIALIQSNAEQKIYTSLSKIPKFIYFQFIALLGSRKANKKSVATKHYHNQSIDKI